MYFKTQYQMPQPTISEMAKLSETPTTTIFEDTDILANTERNPIYDMFKDTDILANTEPAINVLAFNSAEVDWISLGINEHNDLIDQRV